ncbi:MAG TPA: glycosyltransferase family 39 protein [Oscillatoriaceae cyanobacterium]
MRAERRQDLGILLVFGLLYAAFVAVSWAKWPLLTADSARELYVPFQIRHGQLIYRDFYYLYGPFAPYFSATLLATFGDRLAVLYGASVAETAAILGVLYALARQYLRPLPSAAVLFVFLTHFALGQDIWGYLWPYSFAATDSVLFGLVLLLSLVRYMTTGRLPWLASAGVAIALSVATKIEYGFAAVALGGIFLLGRGLLNRALATKRPYWQEALALLVPCLAVVAVAAGLLFSHVTLATVLESTWPTQLMRMWNSTGMWHGTPSTWLWNLRWFALDGLAIAAALLLPWVASRRLPVAIAGLAAYVGGGLALAHVERFYVAQAPTYWMSPTFLLLFGVLGWVLTRLARALRAGEALPDEAVAWGLLAAYGCLIAARTLMTGYNDYTRYQAPVALIAWVALACRWAPAWLASRGALPRPRLSQALLALLVLTLGLRNAVGQVRAYLAPHVAVSGPVGTVLATPDYADPYKQALAYVAAHAGPDDAVVAAPMEASFYLFSGHDNVLREDQLFYGYLVDAEAQRGAIARMRKRHVRYIVLSSYGFGQKRFGKDYMVDLAAWIRSDCRLVGDYGNPQYRLRIYETPFVASAKRVPAE